MKITEDIKYVGVNDHQMDLFEGQYPGLPDHPAYGTGSLRRHRGFHQPSDGAQTAVTIKSALTEDNREQLKALAGELCSE